MRSAWRPSDHSKVWIKVRARVRARVRVRVRARVTIQMSETEAKSEACETDVRESDNVNTCAGGTARVPANYIRSARSLITVLSARAVCARSVRALCALCAW